MGGISVILVKNHFFVLLNKFNLYTIIYNSLKFQTSITVVKSFISPYVICYFYCNFVINFTEILRGAMGGISVILVKNHFFVLLNKFNLHTIIYDSLKFQTSITVVQSFIMPYVNFCAI